MPSQCVLVASCCKAFGQPVVQPQSQLETTCAGPTRHNISVTQAHDFTWLSGHKPPKRRYHRLIHVLLIVFDLPSCCCSILRTRPSSSRLRPLSVSGLFTPIVNKVEVGRVRENPCLDSTLHCEAGTVQLPIPVTKWLAACSAGARVFKKSDLQKFPDAPIDKSRHIMGYCKKTIVILA